MSQSMNIQLTSEKAQSPWDEKTRVTPHDNGLIIHVDENDRLTSIQNGARKIATMGVKQPRLSGDGWCWESQFSFYQGYNSPKQEHSIQYAPMSEHDDKKLQSLITVYQWVKNLINETPENLSPSQLADSAVSFLKEIGGDNIHSNILMGSELATHHYNGLYQVGRGSDRPPVFLTIDFNPSGNDETPVDIALVGKGITFDSGGYSIKTNDGMLYMKIDMGGAATVTGALALAILNGLNQRVKLFLCCADNLISGHAYKLGDIIEYRNGTKVEIANTDAEGRLVLADGLIDASETGAKLIIDAATLTGAAMIAVGTRYNAFMTMDETIRDQFKAISQQHHELHWPLPLNSWHADECPSAFADTLNSKPVKGGGAGGASNAAGFLSRFVKHPESGWLHVDLAGVFCENDNGLFAKGATGLGVRSIAELLLNQA